MENAYRNNNLENAYKNNGNYGGGDFSQHHRPNNNYGNSTNMEANYSRGGYNNKNNGMFSTIIAIGLFCLVFYALFLCKV